MCVNWLYVHTRICSLLFFFNSEISNWIYEIDLFLFELIFLIWLNTPNCIIELKSELR